jgi:hypothetical protein
MQVNPLVPSRKVRIVPSAFIATIVAAALTFLGAARIALAIIFLSAAELGPAFAPLAGAATSAASIVCANAMDRTAAIEPSAKIDLDIAYSLENSTGYPI